MSGNEEKHILPEGSSGITNSNDQHQSALAPKEIVSPLISKTINDVIELCEPSTSNSYAFKTQIQISIIGEPKPSLKSVHSTDTDVSFTALKRMNESNEESFITVDTCQKEKQTSTHEPSLFVTNERTQALQMVTADRRNEPPPPYDYSRAPPPPSYHGREREPPVYYTVAQPGNAGRYQTYQAERGSSQGGRGGLFSDDFYSMTFLEREIRHNFIQKVYIVLSIQLLFTTAFVASAIFYKPLGTFIKTNLPVMIICFVLFFIIYITLICYQAPRRVSPINFILLGLFTLCLAYLTALISVHYETKIVMITFGSTAAVCFLVSLLACQMSCDITKCGMMLLISGLVLLIYGLIIMILGLFMKIKVLFLVYSCLATILFVLYLMYDTQLIMGGRSVSLSPEEYILGALTLYVDMIYIFINLLVIIGHR